MLPWSDGVDVVLLIGLAIFFGAAGARIFQKLHIPQIIGYIVIGILLGPLLKVISPETIGKFEALNVFALGVIGFLIGGELERSTFAKFGKQVFTILLFEGITAFLLVGGLVFLVMLFFQDWHMALAVGVVLGAICAATDPASTVNVLWEFKTRGPLTTMLTAIVALDDALALMLYIAGVSIAGVLTGQQENGGFLMMAIEAVYEIAGSLALGVLAALVLRSIVKRLEDNDKTMVFTIGTIIVTIGLARTLRMDVILSSMSLGVTLVNLLPRQSARSFDLVRKFSPPVYVLFFVLIGARLSVSTMSGMIWLLAAAYVSGSIVGKTAGSFWGATYSGAVPTVRKYLGFCLYQQGTIAIALLIMASTRFEGTPVRDTLLSVIVIGVFTLQLLGPLCLKFGAGKAGEVGMNVTPEDLIKTYTVGDVMDTEPVSIAQDMPIQKVLEIFSTTEDVYYPVLDQQTRITGIITIAGIKEMFAHQDAAGWLLACDVTEPVMDKATAATPLEEALEHMRHFNLEHIPVVTDTDAEKLAGILDYRRVNRKISAEVLSRQQQADNV